MPRTRRLVLFVLLIVPLALHAQDPNAAPWANKMFTNGQPAPPVIVHDFGTVPFGTMLSHKMKITNIYAVPIQITDIRQSCGCVKATAPVPLLQPRESATIDITMDAGKFVGAKTVSIFVTIGPQFVSTAAIQVKAFSRTDVMLNPGQVNFGNVPQGQKPTQTIDVTYNGATPNWLVTNVNIGTAPVDVKAQAFKMQGRPGYRLTVTLKEGAAPGQLEDQIILQTNDPANAQIPVPITASIQAPLAITQSSVRFNAIPLGQESTRRVMVRGSNKPFKVLKVEGEGDGITVELPPVAQEVQIVGIKFAPKRVGDVKREISLITDLPNGSVIKIAVEASAVAP